MALTAETLRTHIGELEVTVTTLTSMLGRLREQLVVLEAATESAKTSTTRASRVVKRAIRPPQFEEEEESIEERNIDPEEDVSMRVSPPPTQPPIRTQRVVSQAAPRAVFRAKPQLDVPPRESFGHAYPVRRTVRPHIDASSGEVKCVMTYKDATKTKTNYEGTTIKGLSVPASYGFQSQETLQVTLSSDPIPGAFGPFVCTSPAKGSGDDRYKWGRWDFVYLPKELREWDQVYLVLA